MTWAAAARLASLDRGVDGPLLLLPPSLLSPGVSRLWLGISRMDGLYLVL